MSCLIPSACVFCQHYHTERNEVTDELPSFDAFVAIPDEIFMPECRPFFAIPEMSPSDFRSENGRQ